VPFVIVVAFLLGGLTRGASGSSGSPTGGPLPAVTVSAPPDDPAALRPCTRLVDSLPLRLAGLDVRPAVSNPSSPFIVAWGQPAIVLRCGVARPAGFRDTSSIIAVDGVNLLPQKTSDATLFTVVDRPVYVDVLVPSSYPQPPLGPIMTVVSRTLKQVCSANQAGQPNVPAKQLCVNRR
jgi:hypothetical protein